MRSAYSVYVVFVLGKLANFTVCRTFFFYLFRDDILFIILGFLLNCFVLDSRFPDNMYAIMCTYSNVKQTFTENTWI